MLPIEHMIQDAVNLGVVRTLELLGVSAGEISQRKALKVYGTWFHNAVEDGRIHPVRVENGRTGTKIYRVADILAVRVQDAARAELR